MNNLLEIVITKDGSHTIYNKFLNAHYHSIHGAIQESKHVFIKNGLQYQSEKKIEEIHILEVGFGTGLNAILSLVFGKEINTKIDYTGIEPNFLDYKTVEKIISSYSNYFDEKIIDKWLNIFLEQNNFYFLNDNFKLKIERINAENFITEQHFDLIFLDAFSFDVQPELWSTDFFSELYNLLNLDGIIVTYAAKGLIKRNLKKSGFIVETLQGPPGKREMIRAFKNSNKIR